MKTERLHPTDRPLFRLCLTGGFMGILLGLIVLSPIYLRHNGQYMDYGDYFLQYIPFIQELKRMLSSGSLAWSWNSFLGDSFTGAYSYYTVYNPFAWFVALFPDSCILYGTLTATLLKLALSMVTSILYFRLFCKRDSSALIGGLIYTFSGFTCINSMFYFFLDVIAVFPLLMYGLELVIRQKKASWYLIGLLINASINYYFFVSTVFLVIIYVIFRLELYRFSGWKCNGRIFLRITGCSLLGTGLACFALIPSFYAILGSGKAQGSLGQSLRFMYWPQEILERLRTLAAPVESGRSYAFYDSAIWSSTGMFLPLFGSAFVLHWCILKKGWLKNICIFLVICYFVPCLNSAFCLFTSEVYARWLYGMVLVFTLTTILTLEKIQDQQQPLKKSLLAAVTLLAAFLVLIPTIVYGLYENGISVVNRFASACVSEFYFGYKRLIIMVILTAVNYLVLWYLAIFPRLKSKPVLYFTVICCILNCFIFNWINYDVTRTDYSTQDFYDKALGEGQPSQESLYSWRVDYPAPIANYGLFKNLPSVKYYNSLQHPSGSRFAASVGMTEKQSDTVIIGPEEYSHLTDALLSVRYFLDYDGQGQIPEGFTFLQENHGVRVYENDHYIPMGFAYDHYLAEEDVSEFTPRQRAELLLHALIIEDGDVPLVSGWLSPADPSDADWEADTLALQKTAGQSFMGTSRGFTAEITLNRDNLVFYSVPYDTGWEITVNGSPVTPLSVNGSLLGSPCQQGENQIEALYHPKGIGTGIVCSLICLSLWGAWALVARRKAGNQVL